MTRNSLLVIIFAVLVGGCNIFAPFYSHTDVDYLVEKGESALEDGDYEEAVSYTHLTLPTKA